MPESKEVLKQSKTKHTDTQHTVLERITILQGHRSLKEPPVVTAGTV